MGEVAPHVYPRTGPRWKNYYAFEGEKTYCENGHLLGHFIRDVKVGAEGSGELIAEPPMAIGDSECPHCNGRIAQSPGQYFFGADIEVPERLKQ